jgi:uncharacterized protein (DUF1499 family)
MEDKRWMEGLHMTWIWIVAAVLAGLGLLLLGGLVYLSCSAERPDDLGLVGGRLRPCPERPNCVSSQARTESHRVEPLGFQGDPGAAWTRLRGMLEGMDRVEVITDDGRYMHVEFTTSVMRFTDDVEFLLQPERGVIDLRSASRVGYSDFGVNRSRIRKLREAWRAGR